MPFDAQLADRVRRVLAGMPGVAEKRMFGGVVWLVRGNMSVGIHRDHLIVRMAADDATRLLGEGDVRVFDITGRPMKGWLMVGPDACAAPAALAQWIERGLAFARGLPPKPGA